MKRFLFLCCCLGYYLTGYTQQDPLFSSYQNNYLYHNPAYAGEVGKKTFTLVARSQWQIPGAPRTFMLSYDQPIEKIRSGIGFVGMYDQAGPQTTIDAGINYSYKLKFSEKSHLRLGTQLGLYHQTDNFNRFRVVNPNDPVISGRKYSGTVLSVDLGTWLTVSKFYLGLGFRHISKPVLRFGDAYFYTLNPHIYFTTGLNISIGEKSILIPSLIARYLPQRDYAISDLSIMYGHQKKYFVGGSLRLTPSGVVLNKFVLMTGINISEKLQIMLYNDMPDAWAGYTLEGNIKVSF